MVKRTGPTNPQLQELIVSLKKLSSESKASVWKRVASDLEAPTRNRRVVNLYKINLHAKDNEIIIVPGKVLATGDINKKVSVAAYTFSSNAREKIKNAKGEALSIPELIAKKPNVQNVRILG